MVRDFVLVGDGWVKDGDFNTTFSRTVLPLPTHASGRYDDAAAARSRTIRSTSGIAPTSRRTTRATSRPTGWRGALTRPAATATDDSGSSRR